MPLYGHELAPEIGPVQARLTFSVSFDKDFIGRDALLKQKLKMSTPNQGGASWWGVAYRVKAIR